MNEIDDYGAVTLVDHLPSLFPNLGCGYIGSGINISRNYISSEIMRRTNKEVNRLTEVTGTILRYTCSI
jgi:hypothetical protein